MVEAECFLDRLRTIVGRRQVIVRLDPASRYTTGFRTGQGSALAVVRPASLVELWRVLQACIDAGKIVIMQAANTGLTGGSTPNGRYPRDVVVINAMKIKGIHLVDSGRQVVCLPGATLNELERLLAPLGREPHSVIGSSCIGASVFGGICNNSGGALIRRGPAYTELALYAQLGANGRLELVNHLGIALGDDPETILTRLQRGNFTGEDVAHDPAFVASDQEYQNHVRKVDEPTAARFNADPRRLFEASGSAGRIALFAARLDTFPAECRTATFYVGTNAPGELTSLRREMLGTFASLPISAEYIHRDAFDLAARYGKDIVIAIERFGTGRLPRLFALQARIDAAARRLKLLPDPFSDILLQKVAALFPDHLPPRLRSFHDHFEHHLLIKVAGADIAETRDYLAGRFPSPAGDFFECTADEAEKAFLHRFAVAGAAVRYRGVHRRHVGGLVAIDVALRRDAGNWNEFLPPEMVGQVVHTLHYGHFFCHVFHHDYILRQGVDEALFKKQLIERLDAAGAQYPAEHNVGHVYPAKPALVNHYRALDPCNTFNPGIGQTSKERNWA